MSFSTIIVNWKHIQKRGGFSTNVNFIRSLSDISITMLSSTQLRHFNAKTLQVSIFVPSPKRLEVSNVVQKFPKNQL